MNAAVKMRSSAHEMWLNNYDTWSYNHINRKHLLSNDSAKKARNRIISEGKDGFCAIFSGEFSVMKTISVSPPEHCDICKQDE